MTYLTANEIKNSIASFSFDKIYLDNSDNPNCDKTGTIVITNEQIIKTISLEGVEHEIQFSSIYKLIYTSAYNKLNKITNDERNIINELSKGNINISLFNTDGFRRILIQLPNLFISVYQYELLKLFFKKYGNMIDEIVSKYSQRENDELIIFNNVNLPEGVVKTNNYKNVLEYAKSIIRDDVEQVYIEDNIIGDTLTDLKRGI